VSGDGAKCTVLEVPVFSLEFDNCENLRLQNICSILIVFAQHDRCVKVFSQNKRLDCRSRLFIAWTRDLTSGPIHDPFDTCEQFSCYDHSDHTVCSSHQDLIETWHVHASCALLKDPCVCHTIDTHYKGALQKHCFAVFLKKNYSARVIIDLSYQTLILTASCPTSVN
jgi:hypothetical protein